MGHARPRRRSRRRALGLEWELRGRNQAGARAPTQPSICSTADARDFRRAVVGRGRGAPAGSRRAVDAEARWLYQERTSDRGPPIGPRAFDAIDRVIQARGRVGAGADGSTARVGGLYDRITVDADRRGYRRSRATARAPSRAPTSGSSARFGSVRVHGSRGHRAGPRALRRVGRPRQGLPPPADDVLSARPARLPRRRGRGRPGADRASRIRPCPFGSPLRRGTSRHLRRADVDMTRRASMRSRLRSRPGHDRPDGRCRAGVHAEPLGSYFEVTPFGGFTCLRRRHPQLRRRPRSTDDVYFGGRARLAVAAVARHRGGAAGFTPTTKTSTGGTDVDFFHASGNLMFTPWQRPRAADRSCSRGGGMSQLTLSDGGTELPQGNARVRRRRPVLADRRGRPAARGARPGVARQGRARPTRSPTR